MADIQSATAEIKRGKKKKKKKKEEENKLQDKNIMSASATQGGHNKPTHNTQILLSVYSQTADLCGGIK